MKRTRVVMELREGQAASINEGEITVRVAEKTGRRSARIVFEMNASTKVRKEVEAPQAPPLPIPA